MSRCAAGNGKEIMYLLQEVNELTLSNLAPELSRLGHSQEYCFDLLGSFRTDKRDTSN